MTQAPTVFRLHVERLDNGQIARETHDISAPSSKDAASTLRANPKLAGAHILKIKKVRS